MTDIVERLREGIFGSDETKTDTVIHAHMQVAADEIERLRKLLHMHGDDADHATLRTLLAERDALKVAIEKQRHTYHEAQWVCGETAATLSDAADEIERLRDQIYESIPKWQANELQREIERLRAECRRLAGEVSRAHRDALAWMERAAAARREGIEAAAARCDTREVGWGGICGYREQEAADCAAAIRALLEDGR